ncbi:hypothetical protein ACQFX9_05725 [Aliinostoc sp. HNIBRCY26]|uniref:hypothetical protein n=1 Tax=Aliinostoc sp. HNIBRCY26 TaxID=3418997 RepID=UPI003D07EBD2
MALYFLILLCAGLMSACFLLKNNHREIAYLVGIFAILSLIAILILAPWQFLLLLLIPVVISTSYEYYINSRVSIETEESQTPILQNEPEDKLIYRGAIYHADNHHKSDEVKTSPITHKLHYRGGIYSVCADGNDSHTTPDTPSTDCKLSFRGNTYSIKLQTEQLKEKASQ